MDNPSKTFSVYSLDMQFSPAFQSGYSTTQSSAMLALLITGSVASEIEFPVLTSKRPGVNDVSVELEELDEEEEEDDDELDEELDEE